MITVPGLEIRANHTAGETPHNTEGVHFTADYIISLLED